MADEKPVRFDLGQIYNSSYGVLLHSWPLYLVVLQIFQPDGLSSACKSICIGGSGFKILANSNTNQRSTLCLKPS